jgi:hypothetical protein
VLGHFEKNNVHRPKPLLKMPAPADGADGAADGGDGAARGPPFGSDLWSARGAIDAAHAALLKLDETSRLLERPDVRAEMTQREAELEAVAAAARAALCASVGLPPDGDAGDAAEARVDAAKFNAVLALCKGQKLLARAIPAMSPDQAGVALARVVRGLLAAPPLPGADDADDDDDRAELAQRAALEEQLLRVVLRELRALAPPRGAGVVALCVRALMAQHSPPNANTLRASLAVRSRAEVAHCLIQRGDELSAAPDGDASGWKALEQAFMKLMMAS